MTIHARKAGKWRRGLAALAASGALVAGGLALAAPAQAAQDGKHGSEGQKEHANGDSFEASGSAKEKSSATKQFNTHSNACSEQGFTCSDSAPKQNAENENKWEWSVTGTKNPPTPGPPPDSGSPGTESIISSPGEGKRWVDGPSCVEVVGWEPVKANMVCDVLRADLGPVDAWALAGPIEGEQQFTPPPPCWTGDGGNNCPVGGALQMAAPEYAIVGVPVTLYAYASWRPDADSPAAPTTGTAVIRVDGEDYSGVEFVDGVAEWRFIPKTEGLKEFTVSGVVSSGISGANAYVDSLPASTYVLEYTPAAYAKALKKKRVEVGQTYVITDPNQAKSYLKGRYDWSVSKKSDDVCAVYETKKGTVKAKFTGKGKCTVIWLDKESEESGKYTFIAKK